MKPFTSKKQYDIINKRGVIMSSKNMDSSVNDFFNKIAEIKQEYKNNNNNAVTEKLLILAKKYCDYTFVGDYLLNLAEEYITNGDYQTGVSIIKIVDENFNYVNNTTLLNLRMAEYHIENNEYDKGIEYLIKLCSSVSNYEESIEFNELTKVWQKYKHLVKDKVAPSVSVNSCSTPLKPEECSMNIEEIFSLPHSELLNELSVHLNEMSANGDALDLLNETEKTVFYIDKLCSEVNSGGFGGYLYYNGHHFNNTCKSLEKIKATEMISLMENIKTKFPKKIIPETIISIQNAIDSLEENGIDFEAEDSLFYDTEEKKLLDILVKFILVNKKKFR